MSEEESKPTNGNETKVSEQSPSIKKEASADSSPAPGEADYSNRTLARLKVNGARNGAGR